MVGKAARPDNVAAFPSWDAYHDGDRRYGDRILRGVGPVRHISYRENNLRNQRNEHVVPTVWLRLYAAAHGQVIRHLQPNHLRCLQHSGSLFDKYLLQFSF